MIRLLRITGFLLIGIGAAIVASYLIKPLRLLWPWLLALPLPIQIGGLIAGFGITLLCGTILWERFDNYESDRSLRDE
ncbi:MAG: hypothetical protein GKS06_08625 [Acidobacteria bacterium]|nr:hypothetical protein [Acidobacteriota bacterium]